MMSPIDLLSHYVIASGCNRTISANFHFTISELEKDFNLEPGYIAGHQSELESNLLKFQQVAEVNIVPEEDDIDMLFWHNYCGVEED